MSDQPDIKNFLEILAGSRRDDSADIDKVLSILSQVSLAVLIIFVMIAILFASKYKDEAEFYKWRAETLAKTSQSEALIDLQRQKLILSLERTNHHYRLHLGHLVFYTTNKQNQRVINTENIIVGRQIRRDFITACNFAYEALKDFDNFVKHYTRMVISGADLAPPDLKVTLDVLDAQNRDWFENQIRESTAALHADSLKLQEDAKEGLALYYQTHMSEVKELQTLADTFAKDPSEEKITLFMRKVNIFVESELQRQNVKLLKRFQKEQG